MKTKTIFSINKIEVLPGGDVSGGFQIIFDGEVEEIMTGLISACEISPNFEKVLCAIANRIITHKAVNKIREQDGDMKSKYEA